MPVYGDTQNWFGSWTSSSTTADYILVPTSPPAPREPTNAEWLDAELDAVCALAVVS